MSSPSSCTIPKLLEGNPPASARLPPSNEPPPALLVAEPPTPSAVKSVSEDYKRKYYDL